MDVLLIDDKDGEGALLVQEWAPYGVRVLHMEKVADFDQLADGGRPDAWPDPPYEVQAAIIDLDLGNEYPGPAGGIVATDKLIRWQRANRTLIPMVLRTQDVDDDRALAAVLAAELAEGPLPLWGKSIADARNLLKFLLRSGEAGSMSEQYGARLVHPVRFIKEERGEHKLGEYLYSGRRADVWERLQDGFDVEPAILAAGYSDHNKFWEQHRSLIAAILYMRDNGRGLHMLGGQTVRLTDVERMIYHKAVEDLGVAIYAVQASDNIDERTAELTIASLENDRAELVAWLSGERKKRPSQKRNIEQGEFLGAFGRVLGHPEVIDIFKH